MLSRIHTPFATRTLSLSVLFLALTTTSWGNTDNIILADATANTKPEIKSETPPSPAPTEPSPHTITQNVTVISQYLYRGLTQTNGHPALQAGVDYSHTSGLYVGIWGSNITWIRDSHFYEPKNPSANMEIDLYGGIKNNFNNSDWGYDLGFLHYDYPGSYPDGKVKAHTNELYGALNWKWISAKYSYSLGDTFGTGNAKGTYYADLTAAIPVRKDVTLTLHAGRQSYKSKNGVDNSVYSYSDYRVELAKSCNNNWQFGVGATNTTAKDAGYTFASINKNIGRGTGYIFAKKTF